MSIQASPPVFDADRFRRTLAGLIDPDAQDGAECASDHKDWAIRIASTLADLFGADLDRLTLWNRIASGLSAGASKCTDGDIDRYISLCLDHVKADPAAVAANPDVQDILAHCNSQTAAWRAGLIRYIGAHLYAVVAHARAAREKAWQERKGGKQ